MVVKKQKVRRPEGGAAIGVEASAVGERKKEPAVETEAGSLNQG